MHPSVVYLAKLAMIFSFHPQQCLLKYSCIELCSKLVLICRVNICCTKLAFILHVKDWLSNHIHYFQVLKETAITHNISGEHQKSMSIELNIQTLKVMVRRIFV